MEGGVATNSLQVHWLRLDFVRHFHFKVRDFALLGPRAISLFRLIILESLAIGCSWAKLVPVFNPRLFE